MIEYVIAPGEAILVDESSEEYAVLFHKTKQDEEYKRFLDNLDQQEE